MHYPFHSASESRDPLINAIFIKFDLFRDSALNLDVLVLLCILAANETADNRVPYPDDDGVKKSLVHEHVTTEAEQMEARKKIHVICSRVHRLHISYI